MNLLLATLAQNTPKGSGGPQLWIGILLMIAVFYFMLFRSGSKPKKKRQEMLANMKKNDRVMTIGGIMGTIVTVKDNEVVIKVDESTNTKMTFIKDAIRTVVQDDTELTMEGDR